MRPDSPTRPLAARIATVLLLLVAVGAVGRSAVGRLDGDAWREVQASFDRLFVGPGNPEEKKEVVTKLVEDGESRSWRMLIDALTAESKFWIEREALVNDRVTKILQVLPIPMAKRTPEMQDELMRWQDQLKGLEVNAREERETLAHITTVVVEGPEALRKALYSKAKGPVDWPVRAAAARVAAVQPDEKISSEFLTRAVSQDKDPRVRMAGLDGMRGYTPPEGEDGQAALDLVESLIIGRLGDAEWGVQLMAVRIVSEREMRSAVPHLINMLEKASPRLGIDVGETLQKLTGENFDPYADVWAKWWEEHKEQFGATGRVRGGDNDRPPPDVTFYGLPVKSDRVIFVIDISSSMKKETKNDDPAAANPPPRGPVTGENVPPPAPEVEHVLSGPKIDVAKDELKKALKKLPRKARFNLVAFNHGVYQWRDAMSEASDENKAEAYKWIQKLEPSGSTFVDGALRLAFRLAGLGAVDKQYADVNADTIILLSDGAPTDNGYPNSRLMDPEDILVHVREWNQLKRVVIHCIGVDLVEGIEFLQKLAAENGGTYLDR